MKYLVNRETKEHIKKGSAPLWLDEDPDWTVVEADDEGWIEWRGKSQECPLPDDAKVAVLFSYDNNPCERLPARDWEWSDKTITHYRPILLAESKPKLDESIFDDDVFTRLSAAVAASESIPALIAEINAMLHPRFEVRERATPEPVEDMSDWRNWKKGDLVKCINEKGWERFRKGDIYAITGKHPEGVYIEGILIIGYIDDFKFHSRPVTK